MLTGVPQPLLITALQTLPRQQVSCTHFIPGKTKAGLCPSLQGGGESGPRQLALLPSQILRGLLPLWLEEACSQAGVDMSPALLESLWGATGPKTLMGRLQQREPFAQELGVLSKGPETRFHILEQIGFCKTHTRCPPVGETGEPQRPGRAAPLPCSCP